MPSENNFLNPNVRERLRTIIRKIYRNFSQLYPGLSIEGLDDDQLFKVAGEQKPIQEVLGEPEIPQFIIG